MCKLGKRFKKIAGENIGKQNDLNKCKDNINCVRCPDQFIGIVEYDGNEFFWKTVELSILTTTDGEGVGLRIKRKKRNNDLKKRKDLPIITIVLESPHIDEYYLNKRNKNVAIGPACGNTGKNIKKYLCKVLSLINNADKLKLQGKMCLIKLVNVIQYQCSLGEDTKVIRTENFLGCWQGDFSEDFKGDFKERLLKYKPNLIINCCTLGGKNLRRKVQIEINNVSDGITLYKCNHPSSWGWIDEVLKKPKPPKKLKSKQKSAL